jgi:RNA polymerase sigma-70 factor (ECF subfamily)
MQENEKNKIDECVVLAQKGASEGFEFLWDYFAPRVKSYISCRINHKSDADDLLSEIFIKVFGKINTYDQTKGAFSTWIFTITRNVLIDYFGSGIHNIQWVDEVSMGDLERSGQIQSIYSQFQNSLEDLEKNADNKENLILKIENLLDELPNQYAELIRLKFFFGMENKEIAALKSKTEGNIRVSLHRALAYAQKMLKRINV